MASQCTALNLSDQTRCVEDATSVNGLFCSFHSRQCQGLYRGYKKRNARLDALEASLPKYLKESRVPLANQEFADITSEDTLHEIYDHLALKYALLDRVIRARKLHHTRFFSLIMDYGHQNYLDILSSRRSIVVRALERLERRVGEVLYKKQKWFKWVRQCQDDEETARDNEKKKVKREAALFRRHMREVQSRMQELRAKEDLKRQETYLDEAYNARLSEEEQEAEWDPIEDVIEDERGNFVDLIKHILLLTEAVDESSQPTKQEASAAGMTAIGGETPEASTTSTAAKKSKRPKQKIPSSETSVCLPDESAHDTKSQVRKRLRQGVKLSYGSGMHVAGTIDNPFETHDKTAPVPEEEIDKLLEDMSEIKHLLFCRLLLSHATVLPAAIRANSVEEFLKDKEVADTDLRDLALKMDNPGLQEIRDACADLGRGEEEEDDEYEEEVVEVDKSKERMKKLGLVNKGPHRGLPEEWAPEREKRVTQQKRERQSIADQSGMFKSLVPDEKPSTLIDFGDLEDEGLFQSKKIRVKICGRYIYNYPSEKAVSRGGWLQYCLIAKDSDLHDAIKLCRHWDEFIDLNILANYQYFPAARWLVWKGDRPKQQLLQLGLIPYTQFKHAEEMTERTQSGSRGQARRAHSVTEVRNFMCANIKRNDPVMRRFLQYLTMQSTKVLVLIRDAKTSKILSSPPDEELWQYRSKSGLGRASKNEWNNTVTIGKGFFEKMEKNREWHFGFNDYYDVYIWDVEPGQPFACLYNTVHDTLFKAHRFCSMKDIYNPAASTLKAITRDPITKRTRDIKPGEDVMSIWDEIQRGQAHRINLDLGCKTLEQQIAKDPHQSKFYNEADMLEDAVLFPEELSVDVPNAALYSGKTNALDEWVKRGPDWPRFIQDADTDDELDDNGKLLRHKSDDDDDDLSEDEYADDRLLENGNADEDSDEPAFSDANSDLSSESKKLLQWVHAQVPEEVRQDMAVMRNWEPPTKYGENPQAEFMTFLDREKSKAFKQCWHAADLHPGAQERQREATILVQQMKKYNARSVDKYKHLPILKFLDVHPHRNRRVDTDAEEAWATAALFFSRGEKFLKSEFGVLHQNSLILNHEQRAQNPPVRRPHTSNQHQPKEFWEEWENHWKTHHRDDPYPEEWDIAIRPTIAKLYKAGVISTHFAPEYSIPGRAMASRNPTGERDLYIDYRIQDKQIFPSDVHHPPSTSHFLSTARQFVQSLPDPKTARFALLRLWSAPHFYPLMIGPDQRWLQAFIDPLGRAWEWRFVPKDMPFSETSIHHALSLRIRPFRGVLGRNVIVKRDLLLVMAAGEDELLKLTAATVFAAQTEPWRLEVDLWRSFVNVDWGFLEGLRGEWVD